MVERIRVTIAFIEPDISWGNVDNEIFNGKQRNELLNREIFYQMKKAKVSTEN